MQIMGSSCAFLELVKQFEVNLSASFDSVFEKARKNKMLCRKVTRSIIYSSKIKNFIDRYTESNPHKISRLNSFRRCFQTIQSLNFCACIF